MSVNAHVKRWQKLIASNLAVIDRLTSGESKLWQTTTTGEVDVSKQEAARLKGINDELKRLVAEWTE